MAGTSFENRRGTAQVWRTANPVLKAGELGYETDTHVIKIGDGVNNWNALPTANDQTYLPILGKAADSDKLDGLDSTAFLTRTDATATYLPSATAASTYLRQDAPVSANTPNAVVKRDANGAFATGAVTGLTTPATDDSAANRKFVNDLATIAGSNRLLAAFQGTGTTFPATNIKTGDLFLHANGAGSSLWTYTGVRWVLAEEPYFATVAARDAWLASLPANLAYEGMRVYVSSQGQYHVYSTTVLTVDGAGTGANLGYKNWRGTQPLVGFFGTAFPASPPAGTSVGLTNTVYSDTANWHCFGMTNNSIADPGFPYRLWASIRYEFQVNAAAARWNERVRAEGLPATFASTYQTEANSGFWQQETFAGYSGVFVGAPGTIHWDGQAVSGGFQVTSFQNQWSWRIEPMGATLPLS
jgi:hypothetical protein